MELHTFVFLSFISRTVLSSSSEVDYKEETKIVFTTVFHKYNERVRPYNYGLDPIKIWANLEFVDVMSVDKKRNVMDSIVDLRLKWEDKRLLWNSPQTKILYITVNESTIWTPDIEFLNAVEPSKVIMKPRFVVIETSGYVYTNHRFRIKTACKGISNTCTVKLGSNFFPESEIVFDEALCSTSEELLTSDMHIEVANTTGNMSAVEQHYHKGLHRFSPSFKKASFSVISCSLTFDNNEMSKMDSISQENVDNGEDNRTNGARQTSQHLGLLIIGICLFFAS